MNELKLDEQPLNPDVTIPDLTTLIEEADERKRKREEAIKQEKGIKESGSHSQKEVEIIEQALRGKKIEYGAWVCEFVKVAEHIAIVLRDPETGLVFEVTPDQMKLFKISPK